MLLHQAGFVQLQTSVDTEIFVLNSRGEGLGQILTRPRTADRVIALGWVDRPTLESYATALREWEQDPDAILVFMMVESVGWVP